MSHSTIKTFETYQVLAQTTAGDHQHDEDAILNWTLGLAGEAGEFANLVKKYIYHQHDIPNLTLVKELGDVLWYIAALCTALNFTLEEVATININKLAKRYPDGFDVQLSRNRVNEE